MQDIPIKEDSVQFGEGKLLVGTLSTPVRPKSNGNVPAVVILNAGFLHRVGPNRLHVKMARSLALEGFTVLRFDFSGVGDSEARRDSVSYERSTLLEVTDAMNFLHETYGAREFVLLGICSGADGAFRVACQDHRVIGGVFINSFTRFTLHYYVSQLFSPRQWKRILFKKKVFRVTLDRVGILAGGLVRLPSGADNDWHVPPPGKISEGLELLAKRGVQLCFIYSRTSSMTYFGYKFVCRFFERSPSSNAPQIELHESADHTFTPLKQQNLLVSRISEWMKSRKWVASQVLIALLGLPLTDVLM
ncbi:MAG: alpha/beta fold hydrolase [Terriglobia bacterium]